MKSLACPMDPHFSVQIYLLHVNMTHSFPSLFDGLVYFLLGTSIPVVLSIYLSIYVCIYYLCLSISISLICFMGSSVSSHLYNRGISYCRL